MNCEKYQNLISAYIDGELDTRTSKNLQAHFSVCESCAKLYADFASIIGFCEGDYEKNTAPPNPQALWCRINNIIESEAEGKTLEVEKEVSKNVKQGWLAATWNSSWQFSPSQILSSVLGIALISSLLTIVGIKNMSPSPDDLSEGEVQPSVFEKALATFGIVETEQDKNTRRIKEQQSAIAYWEKRVEMRKAQWDAHLKEAFNRNLDEIDKAVNDYTKLLEEDPQDKISREMLQTSLDEKMEFLREFSEL